ncbi:Hint domain-containing protein [Chelatococcus reniformis]|uniref:Hedgehog/Intein (Hint) domain-containing protein n=1 Tax=Chelatococcus reniformis TaxID=1494448 RepID=A0A916TZW2_9HYPH|nr:Hint domain-containing protein [Chelatococcus reniformis]GGC49494.1 hypothetical protein GCM10010994_05820 [Chelatococcus reniformis]
MPNYNATNSNGVNYDLTEVVNTSPLPNTYTLVITSPNGIETISGIPLGNVLLTDGGTMTVASDPLAPAFYVVPPGIENVTLNYPAALTNDVVLHIGGEATLNVGASGGSGLTAYVDGGQLDLTSSAGAGLSDAAVNLNNGGGLLVADADALAGATVDFGDGGGRFSADAALAFIDLSSVTFEGYDAKKDEIGFFNLPMGNRLDKYSITTNPDGSQTVVGYVSGPLNMFSFTVADGTFPQGEFDPGLPPGPMGFVGGLDGYSIIVSACFLAGTMVATPDGPVAIEKLKPGDLVSTSDGAVKPVRWLAVQTVSRRFRADPLKVVPIRVLAGALGGGLPARDLFVSPDHALLVDGCLVQAGALVNGTSITRYVQVPQTFLYYHVELDDHSLILVEGVPAETFVDHISRRAFDNWQEAPQAPIAELDRPRVKSWRQLPQPIRDRLTQRAAALAAGDKAA